MQFTRDLTELSDTDIPLAGGKAVALAKMIRADLPVPCGFVVLTNAFKTFLRDNNLSERVDSILQSLRSEDVQGIERAADELRIMILSGEIPKKILRDISESLQQLDADFVAVRSSATVEDMSAASWAGQLETYLDTTTHTLSENLKKCWASLFGHGALFYCLDRGIPARDVSIAVIIQEMVASEVSGVAFSADPVTSDGDLIVIEAGYGLGEAIVSGQVTPDSYIVGKLPLKILDKKIRKQDRTLVRARASGDNWVAIPPLKAGQQKLSDGDIIELGRSVTVIERLFGFPVDVEWAVTTQSDGVRFSILQSRPITTLKRRQDAPLTPLVFEKSITRDWGLIYAEVWHEVFTQEFKRQFNWGYTEVVYEGKNNTITVYRAPREHIEGMRSFVLARLDSDTTWLARQAAIARSLFSAILDFVSKTRERPLSNRTSTDLARLLRTFVRRNIELGPRFIMMLWFPIQMEHYSGSAHYDAAIATAVETRKVIERIGPLVDTFARELAIEAAKRLDLPEELARFMSYHEIVDAFEKEVVVPVDALLRRKDYFILTNEGILHEKLESFLRRNGYALKREEIIESDTLIGQTAYPGLVRGRVKLVHNREMFDGFRRGDILVTSMTTRAFVPIMKLAGAIVTNEGGVTCHAAIISRELEKPCIVGTRIATELLKDGDLVEVDADSAVVRVIEAQ